MTRIIMRTVIFSRITLVLAVAAVNLCMCHDHKSSEEKLKEFHEKWTASDIIRDIDHIKEDIQQLTSLTSEANLTTEEILFYYHRIHDFDNNNLLDGIELRGAFFHSITQSSDDGGSAISDETVERVTDEMLSLDVDNDGFLSYPEIRKLAKM